MVLTSSTVPMADSESPSISRTRYADGFQPGGPSSSTYSTSVPVVLAENSLITGSPGGAAVAGVVAPRAAVTSAEDTISESVARARRER